MRKRAPVIEPEAVAPVKPAKRFASAPGFKVNEFVVYPAHGVGQIVAVEDQEVAGFRLELFVINFAKDKMTLRVPTRRSWASACANCPSPMSPSGRSKSLTGRARIKRTMWSRRAQEYEAKINSGDINAIAEVVRDLYRSEAQPEQSYSERQLYEAALDRMMREIAAVQKLSEIDALKVIESHLKRSRSAAPASRMERKAKSRQSRKPPDASPFRVQRRAAPSSDAAGVSVLRRCTGRAGAVSWSPFRPSSPARIQ